MDFTVDSSFLNQVIKGEITFRKCPNCDSCGIEIQHWSPNTGLPCSSYEEGAYRDKCDSCNGIGFIEIPS